MSVELIWPSYQQTDGRLATNKPFFSNCESLTIELKPSHGICSISRLNCFMTLFGLAEFPCLDFWKL